MSDYISRESVLNTIEDMDKALDTDRTVEEYKALLIECIKALPSRDSITELEKIKTEMTDLDIVSTNGNSAKQVFLLTKDLMISVVENHISELKGE